MGALCFFWCKVAVFIWCSNVCSAVSYTLVGGYYWPYPDVSFSNQLANYGFRVSGIVPDILDTAPSALINITYPSGVSVAMGNLLTLLSVADQPTVGPWEANPAFLYTLIMLDAEGYRSSSTAEQNYYLHWLRYNMQGNVLWTGVNLVPYQGSTLPPDSGPHRYVFLIFQQPGSISPQTPTVDSRATFNLRNFVSQFQLGNPIAGNFYRSAGDNYGTQWVASSNLVS